jgi:ATP-binding protein involved in chromosome partitioning
MQSPKNIRVHKDRRVLELIWTDSDRSLLPFRTVRQNCRCAVCVDEFTGRQILNPDSVPEDLDLVEVSLCGNYALRIRWSDSHDSGLFTWNHLRSVGDDLLRQNTPFENQKQPDNVENQEP